MSYIIGDYDDIDMAGLPRDTYESRVPRQWQDYLRGFGEELRFIYNVVTRRPAIVCRVPHTITGWHGSVLQGWGLVRNCLETPFDPSHQRKIIGEYVRTADFDSSDAAEEYVHQTYENEKAKKQAKRDQDLSDFIDSEYPKNLNEERALERDGAKADKAARDALDVNVQRRKRRGRIKAS